MTRYRLSPEAQGDLNDIKHYLVQEGGARLARYVLGEIRLKLQFLAENPGVGFSRKIPASGTVATTSRASR